MQSILWVCWWLCSMTACRGLGLKLCLLSADALIPQHPCFPQPNVLNSWTFKTYVDFKIYSFFIPLFISDFYYVPITTILIISSVFSKTALSKPAFLETCIFTKLTAWVWSVRSYLRLITLQIWYFCKYRGAIHNKTGERPCLAVMPGNDSWNDYLLYLLLASLKVSPVCSLHLPNLCHRALTLILRMLCKT